MHHWLKTSIEGVTVTWDADDKSARISRVYKLDGSDDLTRDERGDLYRACEAALDSIGVHVLLKPTDVAEAGRAPEGFSEEVLFPSVDDTWTATHKIVFTPAGEAPQAPLYVMCEVDEDGDLDGAAYDRDEWRDEEGGSWWVGDGEHGRGWYCEGKATPGDAVGVVEVEEVLKDLWTLYEDSAGGLWGRPDGEFLAYELEFGEPNRSGIAIAAEWYEHPECHAIARLQRDEEIERLREGGAAARAFLDGPGEVAR